MSAPKNKIISERIFSNLSIELCEQAIRMKGRVYQPDKDSAYMELNIAHPWPVRVAYGTGFHAGTVANSYGTMGSKVLNRGHNLKANGRKTEEPVGAIMDVEFDETPTGGWKIVNAITPSIHAVAVIHKNLELGKKVLQENVDHKYAVSMEVNYDFMHSGFLIERNDAKASDASKKIMDACSPDDFKAAGLAYIPVVISQERNELCPATLEACYDFEDRRVFRDWEGQRVTLLKNGINGSVHFAGVGLVRYASEKEARVRQLLAQDPDKLDGDDLSELFTAFHEAGVRATDSFIATLEFPLK